MVNRIADRLGTRTPIRTGIVPVVAEFEGRADLSADHESGYVLALLHGEWITEVRGV